MTRAIRVELVLAMVFALAPLAGCASSGSNKAGGQSTRKPLVLTLANPLSDSEGLDGFVRAVSRLSRGSLRIDVRNDWRSGLVDYENATIRDVQAGKADLGIAGSRAWDSVGVTSFRGLGAPLLIDSYALQQRVLTSSLVGQMLKGLAPLGLVGIGVLPGPLRVPVGVTRPLLGPSDYAGQRIGVQQSRLASATFRALGATPVWFAVGAPISGMNGVEQGVYNIPGDQYGKTVTVTANVVLWARPLVVVANRDAFAKLTAAQQRVLTQAAAEDVAPETAVQQEDDRVTMGDLCRSHLIRFASANRADVVALQRAVQPVYAALDRDPQTRRQIAQIETMRVGFLPQPTLSCGTPQAVRTAAGLLDGAYQFTLSYADLRAAGADPSESSGNVGTFTFVFDRGHFAETAENPQSCAWDYGSVSVTGSKLSLLYRAGGGIPPGAANSPGEQFTLGWSLYRGSLTMRRVPGAVSPTPFVAEPWLRVSTTPARSFLSARCPPPANALPG